MVLSVLKHFYSVLSLELIKVGQCIKSQTTSIMHSFTCSIVKKLGNFIAYMKILTCKNSKKKRFFDEIFECNIVFNRIERLIEDCFYIVFKRFEAFSEESFYIVLSVQMHFASSVFT